MLSVGGVVVRDHHPGGWVSADGPRFAGGQPSGRWGWAGVGDRAGGCAPTGVVGVGVGGQPSGRWGWVGVVYRAGGCAPTGGGWGWRRRPALWPMGFGLAWVIAQGAALLQGRLGLDVGGQPSGRWGWVGVGDRAGGCAPTGVVGVGVGGQPSGRWGWVGVGNRAGGCAPTGGGWGWM